MYDILVTIKSRADLNYLAKLLAREKIPMAIINTPETAGVTCSLSIKVNQRFMTKIKEIAGVHNIRISNFLRIIKVDNRSRYIKL